MILELIGSLLNVEGPKSGYAQILLVFIVTILSGNILYSWIRKMRTNFLPGPMGLPFVGYLPFLGKEPHKTLQKMSEKYGNIFGLYIGSKYTVILNEYQVMKETLCHPGALDRSNTFDHLLKSGFISANGEEWQEQRRFAISAVRDLGLGKGPWEALMMEEVWSFIKEIEAHKGAPVDISDALSTSVSSNILLPLIGRHLNKITEKDKIQLCLDYAEASFLYMGPSNVGTVMPGLRKYLQMFRIGGYDRAHKIIQQFCQFALDEILQHKATSKFKNIPDFINVYLEELGDLASKEKDAIKHYFSEDNLQGNLMVLFLGGSDTIVSTLGWALRLLVKHQDVQKKLYQELTEVLGQEGYATYEERHKIPYMLAVLMEVQRFASIVPLNTTRSANRDFEINGYTIPKGADIVANLWALHFDSNYWDEPEKFKPERFLNEDGTKILKQVPSYAPFSIGRRNCPGETFASMEILVYLSEIIRKFHIIVPPGVEAEFEEILALVTRLKPQALCFIPR